jgi:hypothetical protein
MMVFPLELSELLSRTRNNHCPSLPVNNIEAK